MDIIGDVCERGGRVSFAGFCRVRLEVVGEARCGFQRVFSYSLIMFLATLKWA